MPLLECRSVDMRFGGLHALSDVDITAEAGAITGLIGPNGAGKTTLFNCITGMIDPTGGRIVVAGKDVTGIPPFKRARLGISRTFQRLELFTSLSVIENIRVAGTIRNRWSKDRIDVNDEAARIVDLIGIGHLATREVSEIPTGMARRVELGRALMTRPKLLLLDEPASGQDEAETEEFGNLLFQLAEQGTGILLVEHDVSLVMKVCAQISVLDFGVIIATGSPQEIQRNDAVIAAYLGEAPI